MYLFDTDTFSNMVDRKRNSDTLRLRVRAEPIENLSISVILIEEYLKRILSVINKERDTPRIVRAFGALNEFCTEITRFRIFPFDETAYHEFQKIPVAVRRAHSQDCRIAAIAIANGLTVLTSNRRHFEKIQGVVFQDWMIEENSDA